MVKKYQKRPAHAFFEITQNQHYQSSFGFKTLHFYAWNGLVKSVPPVFSALAAKVYYQVGEEFFTLFLRQRLVSSQESNATLSVLGVMAGVGGVVANALFNMWAALRYVERVWVVADPLEKSIYGEAKKNEYYWTRVLGLHFFAIFANFAMSYVSWQQEQSLDFWVGVTFLTGIMNYYVSLDMFLDSILWLGDVIRKKSPQDQLNEMIKGYYKKQHDEFLLHKNMFYNEEQGAEFRQIGRWQQLKPYFFMGFAFSFAFFVSRTGLIDKGILAARAMVDLEHFSYELDKILKGVIATLAVLPSIALGIKAFGTLGARVDRWIMDWGKVSSKEISLADQTYPKMTKALLVLALGFTLFSFAGNAQLCAEAAQAWNYTNFGITYFAINGGLGSLITNGFGVINLVYDMVGRYAYYSRDPETRAYARGVYYYKNIAENLAPKIIKKPENTFEYLMYDSEKFTLQEDIKEKVARKIAYSQKDLAKIQAHLPENTNMAQKLSKFGLKFQPAGEELVRKEKQKIPNTPVRVF